MLEVSLAHYTRFATMYHTRFATMYREVDGKLPDAFKVGSENGIVAWELARAGLGICPMDDIVGGRTAGMEVVLKDDLQVTFPIWLVTHREVHASPRIRLVFDIVADAIATP